MKLLIGAFLLINVVAFTMAWIACLLEKSTKDFWEIYRVVVGILGAIAIVVAIIIWMFT